MSKAKPELKVAEPDPTPEPAPKAESKQEPEMTKAEAVRLTVKEGITKPAKGVEYIKEKFGIDITTAAFSSYKTTEAKKAGGAAASGPVKVKGQSKYQPTPNPVDVVVESIVELRSMVDAYGKEKVQMMLDAIS